MYILNLKEFNNNSHKCNKLLLIIILSYLLLGDLDLDFERE